MSRVLPALLSGKRKAASQAAADNADSLSPEKSVKSNDKKAWRRDSRSLSSSELTNGAGGGPLSPSSSRYGAAAMKPSPSNGDPRNVYAVTADGTPVVFDSTTEANHSSNLAYDDRGNKPGRAKSTSTSTGSTASSQDTSLSNHKNINTPTSSNTLPQTAAGEPRLPQRTTVSGGQAVGEGSLSLDTLVPRGPVSEILTPRPHHYPLYQADQDVKLYVTPKSHATTHQENSVPVAIPYEQHQRNYPPVFEHSDIGTSSSSSSLSSPMLEASKVKVNGYFTTQPVIQIEKASSKEDMRSPTLSPGTASIGGSLAPSSSISRGRSDTGTSATQLITSPRPPVLPPSRMRKTSGKKTKGSTGIAGALALSGVALAAPGPNLSQPLHLQGLTMPIKSKQLQRSSSDHGSTNGISTSPSFPTIALTQPSMISRSSEEAPGYDSERPLSQYTPHDSPDYEDDSYGNMVSIDALGDFDDVMSQLGAGYALASSKRNTDFHGIFKNIPEDDYLIEDYGCALQREILIQGRLYISEHHLCFNASIFGWVTTVVIAFNEVIAIEKRNTALVIPNAIHIATLHSRQTFASFISRDTTYDLIVSLWRNQHPVVPSAAALPDSVITDDDDDFALSNMEEEGDSKKKGRRKRREKFRIKRGSHNDAVAEEDVDLTIDASGLDDHDNPDAPGLSTIPSKGRASMGASQLGKKSIVAHPATKCDCENAHGAGHYANIIMDSSFPGSPEKLYNLIFTSGFMKDFLTKDMKLTELQIHDWAPQTSGSHLLTRTYQYIKPLNAPVGPKSAKCILVDENTHIDFDDFVVTLTTTRTPDVPSGGSFSVKTKTCLMWARNGSTRVLVTSAVDWTGRSFIKGIIDRSSLDGQKVLYVALEKSMRAYIAQHKSEFYQGGEDGVVESGNAEGQKNIEQQAEASPTTSGTTVDDFASKTTIQAREPLALLSDCLPALRPVCDFLSTLYDTFADVLGQMSLTALICSAIIIVLLGSNLFTLSSLRKKSSRYVGRRLPPDYSNRIHSMLPVSVESDQHQVAAAVRGVLREYFDAQKRGEENMIGERTFGHKDEAEDVKRLLSALELRIETLKASLDTLD